MLLIKNVNIITMEENDFENGFLAVCDGKIAKIGDMKDFTESFGDEVLDFSGKTVLPGFIDSHCHVGMWEEGLGFEGDDGNEDSDPVTPHLRAIDAINPFDEAFKNAASAGVTTVVTGPGSANVLGGQFAALKTAGLGVDNMLINPYIAQKAALGENPKTVYSSKKQAPITRMATAALLRETLVFAREYVRKWDEYNKNPEENDRPDIDFKLESLVPVIKKEIPLKIHAHRADDILTAIRIAGEFDLKITLDHCTEGHLIADILKEKNYPIILGPTLGTKSKPELKNLSFDIYPALTNKGIKYSIVTDHPEIPIEQLPLCAMLAEKSGISKKDALMAITINAAENAGIADRVGSLKAGKDADFLVVQGTPLTMDMKIVSVYINGKEV
ncbi:MAG: amidohydrolase [Clostridia bacterium]|nr:amidohydrolase [Clostridia bacterium]